MNNVEPHKNETFQESNWLDAPLFAQNEAPQTNPVGIQLSDLTPPVEYAEETLEEFNVEPQTASPLTEPGSSPVETGLPILEDKNSSDERNVVPHQEENVVPQQIVNVVPQQNKNVEPQQNKNVGLQQIENVESEQEKAAAPVNSEKAARQKKSRKKPAKKKNRSQKRNVVPLKFFVSPEEKIGLANQAKQKGCSLSNYIRLGMGLSFNETGRKKQ